MLKKLNKYVLLFKLKELSFIVLYWIVIVRLFIMMEYGRFASFQAVTDQAKAFQLLQGSLLLATMAGFAIGLFTGLAELFWFQKTLKHRRLIVHSLEKVLINFIAILIIAFVTAFCYMVFLRNQDWIGAAGHTMKILTSRGFLITLSYLMLTSLGINLLLMFKNNIGSTIFLPLLFGRYHRPKDENRIFLFIDLKSSTRMAEKLGHVKYSLLLQDCFRDLTDITVQYGGGIYQFVGDEAVITWPARRKGNYLNSIRLFFAFQRLLLAKAVFYCNKYDVVPSFKGAVNCGNVMVAQVGGVIKSEIAYHGDVLNTTSRMMELCKEYEKDLILSKHVFWHIESRADEDIHFTHHGNLQLRGKKRKLDIYSAADTRYE